MKNVKTIIKGSIISIILTMISLLIYAMLLTYTNISENTISTVVIVVTAISILIGSSTASKKMKRNGLVNGAIIGGIYLLTIYSISSIISGNFNINIKSIIMIGIGTLFGVIGGIIGVNTKK